MDLRLADKPLRPEYFVAEDAFETPWLTRFGEQEGAMRILIVFKPQFFMHFLADVENGDSDGGVARFFDPKLAEPLIDVFECALRMQATRRKSGTEDARYVR